MPSGARLIPAPCCARRSRQPASPRRRSPSRLGISRQHLYQIIDEQKPISPVVAARIGRLIGNGGGVWLRMQAAFDLWGAERDKSVTAIKPLRAA